MDPEKLEMDPLQKLEMDPEKLEMDPPQGAQGWEAAGIDGNPSGAEGSEWGYRGPLLEAETPLQCPQLGAGRKNSPRGPRHHWESNPGSPVY